MLRVAWLAVGLSALSLSTAVAQTAPPSGWSISVGAAVVATPRYEGSDRMRVLPLPAVDVRYRDLFFASVRDGIGLNLLSRDIVPGSFEGLAAGPILRWRFGRDQDADGSLRGLGDIDPAGEAGVFASATFGRIFRVRGEVRQGFGGHEGVVIDGAADVLFRLSDTVFGSVGPTLSWSNASYNQTYFGVTPLQALRSGYQTYTPGSGLRSVGISGALVWQATDSVSVSGFASYGRLQDVAADSPFIRRGGSADQVTLGTAITWRLAP